MQNYNLSKMFELVKRYFEKEYGYKVENITLSNQYEPTINSYIYDDKENPAFIHLDELFESTVMSFLLVMFKWAKDFENLDAYSECFRYTLFLMNEVCIFGTMQGQYANDFLLHLVNDDVQILQLAEDSYRTIVVFSLAHEVAHAYLDDIGKHYSKKHPEKEESDADMIAYHIVLKIMMENNDENKILEEYTYLAPMMYMDFFDLYYYTDRVLYKSWFSDPLHPLPIERKRVLFAVVYKDEYELDTVEGNHLYGGFLDVYSEYKDQLFLKTVKRKLDKIIHKDKRELMSGTQEQKRLEFEDELKTILMKESEKLGMNEKNATFILEHYIVVIPDADRKWMIFLGSDAVSYKWSNIRLDLKKAIAAGLELLVAVNYPESLLNYLQLVIVAAFFIQKLTGRAIGKTAAYMVYFLHIRNSYEIGIDEDLLAKEFSTWYQEYSGQAIEKSEIRTAVDNLYYAHILDINSGKIYLKERVVGHI